MTATTIPTDEQKTHRFQVRMRPTAYKLIRNAAEKSDLSVADFMERASLKAAGVRLTRQPRK